MATQKDSGQVDIDDLLPSIDWILPRFVVWACDAGVGDKNVDFSVFLYRRGCRSSYALGSETSTISCDTVFDLPIFSTVARSKSASRSHRETMAPEARRRRAIARPIPCAAPVTIAPVIKIDLIHSSSLNYFVFSLETGADFLFRNGGIRTPREKTRAVPALRFQPKESPASAPSSYRVNPRQW